MRRALVLLVLTGSALGAGVWAFREPSPLHMALALAGAVLVGLLAGARAAIWSLAGRARGYSQITPGNHP